jgi:hypothetical protein
MLTLRKKPQRKRISKTRFPQKERVAGSLEKADFRASKAKYRQFLRFTSKFVGLTPGPYGGSLL